MVKWPGGSYVVAHSRSIRSRGSIWAECQRQSGQGLELYRLITHLSSSVSMSANRLDIAQQARVLHSDHARPFSPCFPGIDSAHTDCPTLLGCLRVSPSARACSVPQRFPRDPHTRTVSRTYTHNLEAGTSPGHDTQKLHRRDTSSTRVRTGRAVSLLPAGIWRERESACWERVMDKRCIDRAVGICTWATRSAPMGQRNVQR
jgi:hypothetical protein